MDTVLSVLISTVEPSGRDNVCHSPTWVVTTSVKCIGRHHPTYATATLATAAIIAANRIGATRRRRRAGAVSVSSDAMFGSLAVRSCDSKVDSWSNNAHVPSYASKAALWLESADNQRANSNFWSGVSPASHRETQSRAASSTGVGSGISEDAAGPEFMANSSRDAPVAGAREICLGQRGNAGSDVGPA